MTDLRSGEQINAEAGSAGGKPFIPSGESQQIEKTRAGEISF
jgi:hypothetical protein